MEEQTKISGELILIKNGQVEHEKKDVARFDLITTEVKGVKDELKKGTDNFKRLFAYFDGITDDRGVVLYPGVIKELAELKDLKETLRVKKKINNMLWGALGGIIAASGTIFAALEFLHYK